MQWLNKENYIGKELDNDLWDELIEKTDIQRLQIYYKKSFLRKPELLCEGTCILFIDYKEKKDSVIKYTENDARIVVDIIFFSIDYHKKNLENRKDKDLDSRCEVVSRGDKDFEIIEE